MLAAMIVPAFQAAAPHAAQPIWVPLALIAAGAVVSWLGWPRR